MEDEKDQGVAPIPEGVELPNPQNSIDHEDVAEIKEVKYDG
jgi:hypothetical protein